MREIIRTFKDGISSRTTAAYRATGLRSTLRAETEQIDTKIQ